MPLDGLRANGRFDDMEWKTRVTDLLGCRYPIIQGAFGGFGRSVLAAPVSEAGGFGIITATALNTPQRLRKDIRKARTMTEKPFGVNLSLIGHPRIDELRDVAIEEKVSAIFTSAYKAEEHGRRIREAGIPWIHKVGTLKHALAAERQGADAVVMVGIEGEGEKAALHLSTLTSVTMAARELRIPVIAAGGIGDGRGFLAALAMGAEGVYMGTAFMATKECPIAERHKRALIKASPYDPDLRDRIFAPPPPGLDELTRKQEVWQLVGDAKVHSVSQPLPVMGGSMAVGSIARIVTVKELIDGIIREAEELLIGDSPLGRILQTRGKFHRS
ncbi:MAG TPA: nitronate monooxygenase [Dehalococcoidia bacterium]|nr:nitronate monooxygenase [Dehalococcoidia bacterium]